MSIFMLETTCKLEEKPAVQIQSNLSLRDLPWK